jgi:hypothetical protein
LKKKALSEKQQGKWPQVQAHAQPQVEERSLPLMLPSWRNQVRRR